MNKRKKRFTLVQKIILGVIGATFITIIIATISILSSKPENVVTSKIEALASDYYENYLYQGILDSNRFSGNIEETLQKYVDVGFSPITLRELLLHDTKKSNDFASFIKNYCDENRTTIKFYPEAPFTKTSYHIDYSYSCEF